MESYVASAKFGVKTLDILVELGKRRMVGGQEDMIVDVARGPIEAEAGTESAHWLKTARVRSGVRENWVFAYVRVGAGGPGLHHGALRCHAWNSSTGIGLPMKYPWMTSQPNSVIRSHTA